jgi:isopentenyl-diphosphate Delta-isomerase
MRDSASIGTSGELVVLVDRDDNELGSAPKLQVHRDGVLHRAVSVFLVDDAGRVLLQRRALDKYHSGGLWSNTCCGHPRPGEPADIAARRRLREEMGIICSLGFVGRFIYKAPLGNGLIEHELDHVFLGRFVGAPAPDRSEVAGWRWMSLTDLVSDHANRPERYTAWIGPAMAALLSIGISRDDARKSRDLARVAEIPDGIMPPLIDPSPTTRLEGMGERSRLTVDGA